METNLVGQGSTPDHEEWQSQQGDPTIQPVYQGTRVQEKSKPEEFLKHSNIELKVVASNPTDNEVFLAILPTKSQDNVDFYLHVPIQSWLQPNHCKLWQNFQSKNPFVMWQITVMSVFCLFN